MAVRFILGRSGTGKTSYCIRAVVDALLEPAGRPLILLVPEQATYQAERAILADERIAGYSRLHVLSFDRLQLMLVDRYIARPRISPIARQMIIHRLLRRNTEQLKLFNSVADHPGLARRMADAVTELHQYAKTPDDIEQLLAELQKSELARLTRLKFADIRLILTGYLDFIEGRFLDPDVQLARACRAVTDADFVKNAKLWVDGFAGFTTAELAILTEMLKTARDSEIALCLDPCEIESPCPNGKDIDRAKLFYPTHLTYCELLERIKKSKLPLTDPIILTEPVRFSACPQLAHVEWSAAEDEPSKMPVGDGIRIISAPNARAEVRFVAEQIRDLVRRKGYRYRDIAVIASDIERYQHYVEAYFKDSEQDRGIPFFLDKRRPLSRHPLVALVCSALRIATAGFSGSELFTCLKTDLVPVERSDVDLLENYCLAFGITPSDWRSETPWCFAGAAGEHFDEEHINRIRERIARPLHRFREKLCISDGEQKTIEADVFTRAVFDLLDDLEVGEKIADWIEQAADRSDQPTIEWHQQSYGKIVDVFDELAEVFAETPMTVEDFLTVLTSALSQLTLAFIPPSLDQVLVGSIERSRHPDLKAVFLIGATQRQFPVPIASGGIFTDTDRSLADQAGFQLAGGTGRTLAERRYLAYIAFTRPSDFLCVTYPAVDEKGGAVPRSQFVAELQERFDDLAEESIAGHLPDIEHVRSNSELIDLLCTQLGGDPVAPQSSDRALLEGLLDSISRDKQLSDAGRKVRAAVTYDNCAELNEETVSRLFDKQLNSSATRLSAFAACPYQHFARYMLELRERKEFKFEPLDLGNFYHMVLDALLKHLKAAGNSLSAISDDELLKTLRDRISKLTAEDAFLANFSRHGPHNAFIIHNASAILEDCVIAIAKMVRAGSFAPALSEVSFGRVRDAAETLGEFELPLPDGRTLSLSGKIDRLDTARIEDRDVAIVFDYKRRGKSFNWTALFYGLDMQLPIYMLAVRNASDPERSCEAVGAFYMPVEVATASTTIDELPKAAEKFRHKAAGIFNGDFFQALDAADTNQFYNFFVTAKQDQYGYDTRSGALRPDDFHKVLQFAEQKILALALDIVSGNIGILPYRWGTKSPCTYCKYKPVCRHDWQINDYNMLPSLDKIAALESMEAAHG